MNIGPKNNKVNSYFRLMKNWDAESKKDMINKLTQSINDKSDDKRDFSSCFGAWDDVRSADKIIGDIQRDSVNNLDIEEF
ncbi:MAG: hypothetical protein JW894_01110 [Bacteroidales bacterium]|nr:hypothetical protein [Bacteroidales bacterium]